MASIAAIRIADRTGFDALSAAAFALIRAHETHHSVAVATELAAVGRVLLEGDAGDAGKRAVGVEEISRLFPAL